MPHLLPPNLAEQVKFSRFVNTHGHSGHNISCDLHMEHLNRLVKVAIEGLGAEKAIKRAAKAMGVLSTVMQSFDSRVGVCTQSGKHSEKAMMKDLAPIVSQLMDCQVFTPSNTTHASFSRLKKNCLKTLNEKALKDWMIERFSMLSQPDSAPTQMDNLDSSDDDD